MKIVPGYDQARHIIEGGGMHDYGTGLVPQPDPVDPHNPMDFPKPGDGQFSGNTNDIIGMINANNAAGLASDGANLGQSMINMAVANNCMDEPTKGGLAYGPRFTGDY